jgi:tetratricopeptide (TPR) repeat protein
VDEAIEHYSKAIGIKPSHIGAFFNHGLAYARKKEFLKAIEDETKVIEMNPTLVDAYYTRGLIYEYLSDYDKAVVDYKKVLDLDSSHRGAREQLDLLSQKK